MPGSATLIAAAVTIAIANLWLTVICTRHRAVLGGATALAGWALLGFAGARGLTTSAAHAAVGLGGVCVLLGAALFGLGQRVERLLEEPDDGPADPGANAPPGND